MAVISLDCGSQATTPRHRLAWVAQTLTRCRQRNPLLGLAEPLTALPSMAS